MKAVALAFMLAALVMAAPLIAEAYLPTGEPVAGIRCERMEGTAYHIHAHLAVFDHGKAVPIPEDIGRPLFAGCFYWLHTHTPDGIIHVESPVFRTFTIGQFFAIWGQPLTKTQAATAKLRKGETMTVWVDGNRYKGDPRSIQLAEHLDVTIDVGPPAGKPAPFTDWHGQ
jgi:hypothetical protein